MWEEPDVTIAFRAFDTSLLQACREPPSLIAVDMMREPSQHPAQVAGAHHVDVDVVDRGAPRPLLHAGDAHDGRNVVRQSGRSPDGRRLGDRLPQRPAREHASPDSKPSVAIPADTAGGAFHFDDRQHRAQHDDVDIASPVR